MACNSTKSPTLVSDCGPWNFGIAQGSSYDLQFLSESWVQEARATCLKTVYAKGFDAFDPPIDAKFAYRSEESSIKRRAVHAVEARNGVEKSETIPRAVFQATLRNTSHLFEFDSYSQWEASVSPSPLYQVFAKNREGRAALSLVSMTRIHF